MPIGTVKHIVADRGFGFLSPEAGGSDLFYHCKSVDPFIIFESMTGMRVEYDIQHDAARGKDQAVNVRSVGA